MGTSGLGGMGSFRDLRGLEEDFGIRFDDVLFRIETNVNAAASYAAAAQFNATGVCVGAYIGPSAQYLAVLLYKTTQKVHPVEVASKSGIVLKNVKVGEETTSAQGLLFEATDDEKIGDFGEIVVEYEPGFAYTVTVKFAEGEAPNFEAKPLVELVVGAEKRVSCSHKGGLAFSCVFTPTDVQNFDMTFTVRPVVSLGGYVQIAAAA